MYRKHQAHGLEAKNVVTSRCVSFVDGSELTSQARHFSFVQLDEKGQDTPIVSIAEANTAGPLPFEHNGRMYRRL